AAAVHGGVNTAGVGEFAGVAEGGLGIPGAEAFFGVDGIQRQAGERGECLFALGGRGGFGFGFRYAVQGHDVAFTTCGRSGTKLPRKTQTSPPRQQQERQASETRRASKRETLR